MTPARERQLWRMALVLVLAIVLWRELQHLWPEAPEASTTILLHRTVAQVRAHRPTVTPSMTERLIYVPVLPGRIEQSDTHTDRISVTFCTDLSTRDSTTPTAPRLLLDAGSYKGHTLTLWGVGSDASAFSRVYPGVTAPFRFGVEADSVYVRRARGWLGFPGWALRALELGVVTVAAYKVGQATAK